MLQLTDRKWGKFLISDVAEIEPGEGLPKKYMVEGRVPFIAAKQELNGVDCFVGNKNPSLESDCISLNNTGSVGFCFYHPYPALYSNNISKLRPIVRNKYTSLFLCVAIRSQTRKYSYGYILATSRIKRQEILLPVDNGSGNPDWEFMEAYMREKEQLLLRPVVEKLSKRLAVEAKIVTGERKWKEFFFTEIFKIEKGFYNKKPEFGEEGDIPFIGASASVNGITGFTDYETISKSSKTGHGENEPIDKKIFERNAICVTNNGSVGYAYYQEHLFTCSHDVNPLYLRDRYLNRHLAMFLIACIEQQRVCFSFAKKWRPKRMVNSRLCLPIDSSGNPDWEYMENCAKNAENKILAEYLSLVRDRILPTKVK